MDEKHVNAKLSSSNGDGASTLKICPNCFYSLRGLSAGRNCPECGVDPHTVENPLILGENLGIFIRLARSAGLLALSLALGIMPYACLFVVNNISRASWDHLMHVLRTPFFYTKIAAMICGVAGVVLLRAPGSFRLSIPTKIAVCAGIPAGIFFTTLAIHAINVGVDVFLSLRPFAPIHPPPGHVSRIYPMAAPMASSGILFGVGILALSRHLTRLTRTMGWSSRFNGLSLWTGSFGIGLCLLCLFLWILLWANEILRHEPLASLSGFLVTLSLDWTLISAVSAIVSLAGFRRRLRRLVRAIRNDEQAGRLVQDDEPSLSA